MAQNGSSAFNNEDGTNRFRRIRTTPEENESLPPDAIPASSPDPQAGTRPAAAAASEADSAQPHRPLDALARLKQTQQVKVESAKQEEPPQPASSRKGIDFKAFVARRKSSAPAGQPAPAVKAGEEKPASPSRQRRYAPAFWTIASALSLSINIILIVALIFLLNYVSRLNIKVNELLTLTRLPEETVKGLYENFVLMDNAHIRTQIPISLEVPVKFDIAINTQTEVTLSQDTPISQARVTLTTGGLNITNAPANIVLPAGTRLPINLSLVVPVDKSVPVSLVVPVDIALRDTDLHAPFVGLQQVVQPLYCLLNPNATSNAGVFLCAPASTP